MQKFEEADRTAKEKGIEVIATPNNPPSPLIVLPDEASAYLAQMDIDVEDIRYAVEAGEVAAGNITRHHPVNGAGLSRWMHVVGGVRERLALHKTWHGENPRNRPVSAHTKLPFKLSTVGGDAATGVAEHASGPMAARRKGVGTAEAVTQTIPLFAVEALRQPSLLSGDGSAPPAGNWFLVYHRAENGVRMEVSKPAGFDPEQGQFTGWVVRVILRDWEPPAAARRPLDVGGQDVDFRIIEAS